ncbi:hypothetical protein HK098_004931 [Nowakowskiella sp. JEL0407]|nr:hypothetical protein HK098_004931 [Nowakowskiella sp. JEL0407]
MLSSPGKNSKYIDQLPPELILKISSYLPRCKNFHSDALLNFSSSCKFIYNANLPYLLKRITLNDYSMFQLGRNQHYYSRVETHTTHVRYFKCNNNFVEPEEDWFVRLRGFSILFSSELYDPNSFYLRFFRPVFECEPQSLNLRIFKIEKFVLCESILVIIGRMFEDAVNLEVFHMLCTSIDDNCPIEKASGFIEGFAKLRNLCECVFVNSVTQTSNLRMTDHLFDSILRSLGQKTTMRRFTLSNFLLKASSFEELFRFLSGSRLYDLRLENLRLPSAFAETMKECGPFTNIHLEDAFFWKHFLSNWLKGPFNRPKSLTLIGDLNYSIPETAPPIDFEGLISLKTKCQSYTRYYSNEYTLLPHIIRSAASCGTLTDFTCVIYNEQTLIEVTKLITNSKSLRKVSLQIEFECIMESVVREFFDALIANTNLLVLKITNVVMPTQGAFAELMRLLSSNCFLEEIGLCISEYTDVYDLISAAKRNRESNIKRIVLLPALNEDSQNYAVIDFLFLHRRMRFVGSYRAVFPKVTVAKHRSTIAMIFQNWSDGEFLIDRIVVDEVFDYEMRDFSDEFDEWFEKGIVFGYMDGEYCILFDKSKVVVKEEKPKRGLKKIVRKVMMAKYFLE